MAGTGADFPTSWRYHRQWSTISENSVEKASRKWQMHGNSRSSNDSTSWPACRCRVLPWHLSQHRSPRFLSIHYPGFNLFYGERASWSLGILHCLTSWRAGHASMRLSLAASGRLPERFLLFITVPITSHVPLP